MDQLVALMMEEQGVEPSEQFSSILRTLDPVEVGKLIHHFNELFGHPL